MKKKTGNSGDKQFVEAFVTASLMVCIGTMAIVGAKPYEWLSCSKK